MKTLTLHGTSPLPIFGMTPNPTPSGNLSLREGEEIVPTKLTILTQPDGRIRARVRELGTLYNGHRGENRLHVVKDLLPDAQVSHWLDRSDNPWEGIQFIGEHIILEGKAPCLDLSSADNWASFHVSLQYVYREYERDEPRMGRPVIFKICLDEKSQEAMRQFVASYRELEHG